MISASLISLLRGHFALDWHGIHGAAHWSRVRRIGLCLAALTGANTRVVELFSFLHDSCRRSDGRDPDHGGRAALFVEKLNGRYLHLDDLERHLLVEACRGHSGGGTHDDPTIATCWDADRLELARLGITPDHRRLCTSAAIEPAFYNWAHGYSAAYAGRYFQEFSRQTMRPGKT